MRFLLLAAGCGLLFAGCGRTDGTHDGAGPVIARWHFAGAANLKASPDAAALRKALANTNTQDLLDQALDRLTASVTRGSNAAPGGSPLPRRLFSELQRVESFVEARGTNAAAPDWVFALRLGSAAEWWVTNAPALGMALGRPATGAVANDWALIGLGNAGMASLPRLASEIRKDGRPAGVRPEAWMQLGLDLPSLAPVLGLPASIPWPAVDFAWAGRGERLRMEGTLRFAKPTVPAPETWRIPTNSIREPLIGFSALQGVAGWLSKQTWHQRLGILPPPNQVFGWAQSQIPFQMYVAWQWPDVTNTLRAVAPKLEPLAKEHLPTVMVGSVTHATNQTRINWLGLPIWVPFLAPALDAGFVVSGLMPTEGGRVPAPPELFAELTGRTNVVFYDWEITQARLTDWIMTDSLRRLIAGYESASTNSLSHRWLNDTNVTSLLGNSVTEVTRVSPTELRVLRSSSAGLTGIELFTLVKWLDDPAFPRRSEPPAIKSRRAAVPPSIR